MRLGILSCLMGSHEPRRRGVHMRDDELVGRCRSCGTALIRRGHRDWIVDAGAGGKTGPASNVGGGI